jgi:gluconate 5-dehydrogenase
MPHPTTVRPPTSFSLTGKTAFISGSARGLGLEMARGLAAAGAHVLINGRDADALARAVALLADDGITVKSVLGDATSERFIDDVAEALSDRVDILVNNVGARDRRGFHEMGTPDFHALIQTNLVGPYALSRPFAQGMIERGVGGRIINVSSIIARAARQGDVAYASAKAGLEGLTRAMAADLGPSGITVNAVAPGPIATETNSQLADDPVWTDWLRGRTMLGRWGRPGELAGIVAFLASDHASFISGQTIDVDGGMISRF